MTTNHAAAQDPQENSSPPAAETAAGLTIGELADRTGTSPATLRMWEARHGFPRAHRLPSGHRRYDSSIVDQVREVRRRRDAGVRLDVAVAEVARSLEVSAPSVYAELRRRHPHLLPHRLRKTTLLALSWALEDECCARAQHPWLFGAFQHERFLRQAETRWQDLARTARGAWAMARFPTEPPPAPTVSASDPWPDGPVLVALPATAPMAREWSVVCAAPDHPAVLAAWELPGQAGVPDRERLFESVWALEAQPARDAARVCARVAGALGHDTEAVLSDLEYPAGADAGLRHATNVFNRVVAYLDRLR